MGQSGSRESRVTGRAKERKNEESTDKSQKQVPADGAFVELPVSSIRIAGNTVPDLPDCMLLRFEHECMVLMAVKSREVLRNFPYFTVMSWGSTDSSFVFRVFDDFERATKGVHRRRSSAHTDKDAAKAAGAVYTHGARGVGVDDARDSKPPSVPEDAVSAAAKSREPKSAGQPPVGGACDASAATLTAGGDSAATTGDSSSDADPEAEPIDAVASTLISMDSTHPRDIEACIMQAVLALMREMQQKGLTEGEMAAVRSALEEDGDEALDRLRTLAVTRRFDARQAAEILQDIGRLSPFDKVEAAVLLHGSLMSGTSFKLLLEQFEDEDERDNVCARLGLKLADII